MTNEEYVNYFIQKNEIIKDAEQTKNFNYILISCVVITSIALLLKYIDEQKQKEQIKLIRRNLN